MQRHEENVVLAKPGQGVVLPLSLQQEAFLTRYLVESSPRNAAQLSIEAVTTAMDAIPGSGTGDKRVTEAVEASTKRLNDDLLKAAREIGAPAPPSWGGVLVVHPDLLRGGMATHEETYVSGDAFEVLQPRQFLIDPKLSMVVPRFNDDGTRVIGFQARVNGWYVQEPPAWGTIEEATEPDRRPFNASTSPAVYQNIQQLRDDLRRIGFFDAAGQVAKPEAISPVVYRLLLTYTHHKKLRRGIEQVLQSFAETIRHRPVTFASLRDAEDFFSVLDAQGRITVLGGQARSGNLSSQAAAALLTTLAQWYLNVRTAEVATDSDRQLFQRQLGVSADRMNALLEHRDRAVDLNEETGTDWDTVSDPEHIEALMKALHGVVTRPRAERLAQEIARFRGQFWHVTELLEIGGPSDRLTSQEFAQVFPYVRLTPRALPEQRIIGSNGAGRMARAELIAWLSALIRGETPSAQIRVLNSRTVNPAKVQDMVWDPIYAPKLLEALKAVDPSATVNDLIVDTFEDPDLNDSRGRPVRDAKGKPMRYVRIRRIGNPQGVDSSYLTPKIYLTNYSRPSDIPWGAFGVTEVWEATGSFREPGQALEHMEGRLQEMLSLPAEEFEGIVRRLEEKLEEGESWQDLETKKKVPAGTAQIVREAFLQRLSRLADRYQQRSINSARLRPIFSRRCSKSAPG